MKQLVEIFYVLWNNCKVCNRILCKLPFAFVKLTIDKMLVTNFVTHVTKIQIMSMHPKLPPAFIFSKKKSLSVTIFGFWWQVSDFGDKFIEFPKFIYEKVTNINYGTFNFFKKSVRGSTDEGINEVILGCLESHPIENDHFKRFSVKRYRSYRLKWPPGVRDG